jgi:lysophospholipase L1-like esterase
MKSIQRIKLLIIFTLFLLIGKGVFGQNLPKFNANDNICFIGNSITQDGRYHLFLQTYFATRHSDVKLNFFNCGISGDVADGMLDRFENDILIHKPNYAFLMVGMNDIQSGLYAPNLKLDEALLKKRKNALDNYYVKTEKLTKLIVKNGIKPFFLTPSIYDQTSKVKKQNNFGANDALEKCAIHIRALAKKHHATLVDFQPNMLKANAQLQKENPTFTVVGPDRIHPGNLGHFTMAYFILNKIVTKNVVSKIKIHGKKKKILETKNCEVEIAQDKGLEFKVTSKSLPFPLHKINLKALELVPFQQEYNREILQVSHLKKGTYQLKINNQVINEYSSKELKKGIDLSKELNTPQNKQAKKVFDLCTKYHNINGKLRVIALIEYRNLKNYKGTDNLEEKRNYLMLEAEKQKGKSWYGYIVKTCNQYFNLISKQDNLKKELTTIRNKIYNSNRPQQYTYKLTQVNN